MKIYIPSHKRAGMAITFDYLPEAFLCVNEDEVEEYADFYPREQIIALPISVKGNMAKVRNYLMDNCDDEHLLMLDDDIKYIGRITADGKRLKMTADEARVLFERGFIMAEDLGVKLWGVNVQNDAMFYVEFIPFSTQSPVLGVLSGHILRDNPLRYDERLGLKEDYDFVLQHLQKYHKILRFNMHYYLCGHLVGNGGCTAYRTMDEEKRQLELLQRKWGSKRVSYNLLKSVNPIINSPYSGT